MVDQLRGCLNEHATAVLDIGCGEGYYTHAFADALPEVTTFGLDVSKVAIKAAAKRYQQVTFCVASSHRLPFADASMDAIIRIYAPCKAEELARVVKPCGWVITVTPWPRHLMELKGLIYDEVLLHAPILNNWRVLHYSRAMHCGIRCVFAVMKLSHCYR